MNHLTQLMAAALLAIGGSAAAGNWTLDAENSRLAFGSVKNSWNGEVHSFTSIAGTVDDAGAVALDIQLGSLETNIDIRNERMINHVFKNAPAAKISAQIDRAALEAMNIGESQIIEVDAALDFVGVNADVSGDFFVMRLSEDRVMVSSNDFIFLDLDDIEANAGIDKLQELASLDSIARTTPVSLRLIFSQN